MILIHLPLPLIHSYDQEASLLGLGWPSFLSNNTVVRQSLVMIA